ncbi:unnamed protein product [Boreogadus saida]
MLTVAEEPSRLKKLSPLGSTPSQSPALIGRGRNSRVSSSRGHQSAHSDKGRNFLPPGCQSGPLRHTPPRYNVMRTGDALY